MDLVRLGLVFLSEEDEFLLCCLNRDNQDEDGTYDDDEDAPPPQKRKHRWWVRPWILRRMEEAQQNTMFKLQSELIAMDDTAEFRALLRMDRATFVLLVEKLRPHIERQDTQFRRAIPVEERLCITLKYIATGESRVSISQQFRVGRTTVSRIIKHTCRAIVLHMMDDYIQTPNDSQTWKDLAQVFQHRWQFPNCIGAVDGKHVRIYPPPRSGSYFYNYKGFFSIIMMAVANANCEFIYVDVGTQGRAGDARVWNSCSFSDALYAGHLNVPAYTTLPGTDIKMPYVLVGDNAFCMTKNLIKPYTRRDMSEEELIFNYRLSRARRTVESAFGIMANRFRIFLQAMYMKPETAIDVVLACCTLHNFLRKQIGSNYVKLTPSEKATMARLSKNEEGPGIKPLETAIARNPPSNAKAVRDGMKAYFVSPEGKVPWQRKKAGLVELPEDNRDN